MVRQPLARKHSRIATKQRSADTLALLVFVLPGLAWFLTFALVPLVNSLRMSFYEWPIAGVARFVGLANYARAMKDPIIWVCLRNTLVYWAVTVPGQMFFALIVAALLRDRIRGKVAFRVVYYLPVISSWVVVSLMFMYLFHSQGPLNYLLCDVLGVIQRPVGWLFRPWTAIAVICILGIWKGIGWSMVVFLAALEGIPPEVEEAAQIDGATGWQTLTRVVVPLLRPTVLFVFVMLTIGAFQAFISFFIMTRGEPADQTQVFLSYMYKQAFNFLEMGYGAAIAYILTAILAAFSVVQFRLLNRQVEV